MKHKWIMIGAAALVAYLASAKKPTRIEIKKRGVFGQSASDSGQALFYDYKVFIDKDLYYEGAIWVIYPKPPASEWNVAPLQNSDPSGQVMIEKLVFTEGNKYYLQIDLYINNELKARNKIQVY